MRARDAARVIPEGSHRYWSVTLDDRGAHHFRVPTFDVLAAVNNSIAPAFQDAREGEELTLAAMMARAPYMAAMIGACWWHRGYDLDAEVPPAVTAESVLAYGRAVLGELQDEDYSLFEVNELFAGVAAITNDRLSIGGLAKTRADFSRPPEEPLPVSPPRSGSSTSGGPSGSTTSTETA